MHPGQGLQVSYIVSIVSQASPQAKTCKTWQQTDQDCLERCDIDKDQQIARIDHQIIGSSDSGLLDAQRLQQYNICLILQVNSFVVTLGMTYEVHV